MTYDIDKEVLLAGLLELQQTRVEYTGRNLLARDKRRVRIHNDGIKGSSITTPAEPTHVWLNNTSFEDTYYKVNSIGHQSKVRKDWTAALIKDIEDITVGANKSIEWFLEDLGQWLTDHMPGFYVIVQHKVETINGQITFQSITFKVLKTR